MVGESWSGAKSCKNRAKYPDISRNPRGFADLADFGTNRNPSLRLGSEDRAAEFDDLRGSHRSHPQAQAGQGGPRVSGRYGTLRSDVLVRPARAPVRVAMSTVVRKPSRKHPEGQQSVSPVARRRRADDVEAEQTRRARRTREGQGAGRCGDQQEDVRRD